MRNETDWSQKYRPYVFNQMILPANLYQNVKKLISNQGGMSVLLSGPAGCGKTTVAKLINTTDNFFVDCSIFRSIEMIRDLTKYCSTFSLYDTRKLVILDEADHLSHDAQNALRGMIEHYSSTTDFVMTANTPNKLSTPIRSRCYVINFDLRSDSSAKMKINKRCLEILFREGVKNFNKKEVEKIVDQNFPDIRRTLKQLQFEMG